ncbi:MAG: hypothetical protein IT480_18740 [Gammaproteobacteria bacterium]|nr:hypothetical protein [Gammaproteobacteria bacterium]
MTLPWIQKMEADTVGCAAATDQYTVIGQAPYAATVTSVVYIPEDSVTGLTLATAARTFTVYNRGTGSGTVSVATLTCSSGTNLSQYTAFTLTLGTAANLVLASGDVLELESLHITTGVLDPGGKIIVTYSRT